MSDSVDLEARKFLERDFNQSFEQLRHYDSQIFEIGKFVLVSYGSIATLAIGLYEFSRKEGVNLTLTAGALIAIGLLHGLVLFGMATSDRAYFVKVARYLNEHRHFFLKSQPLGFENSTKMWTSLEYPAYYDWKSSQMFLCNLVAAFNAALLGLLIWMFEDHPTWIQIAISIVGLLAVQIGVARAYLLSHEPKRLKENRDSRHGLRKGVRGK